MRLDDGDKRILADIARQALAAALAGKPYTPTMSDRPALQEKCGCFVTLKTCGALRGCLGCFTSELPLYRTVAAYAAHSALDDPRFTRNRLKIDDVDKVEMEISVLSPLKPCADPEAIRMGTDGIYVKHYGQSGCFLPQVATETGWSVEEFWGHCCRDKAGLEWDAWRAPGVELWTFTAEVFEC